MSTDSVTEPYTARHSHRVERGGGDFPDQRQFFVVSAPEALRPGVMSMPAAAAAVSGIRRPG